MSKETKTFLLFSFITGLTLYACALLGRLHCWGTMLADPLPRFPEPAWMPEPLLLACTSLVHAALATATFPCAQSLLAGTSEDESSFIVFAALSVNAMVWYFGVMTNAHLTAMYDALVIGCLLFWIAVFWMLSVILCAVNKMFTACCQSNHS